MKFNADMPPATIKGIIYYTFIRLVSVFQSKYWSKYSKSYSLIILKNQLVFKNLFCSFCRLALQTRQRRVEIVEKTLFRPIRILSFLL